MSPKAYTPAGRPLQAADCQKSTHTYLQVGHSGQQIVKKAHTHLPTRIIYWTCSCSDHHTDLPGFEWESKSTHTCRSATPGSRLPKKHTHLPAGRPLRAADCQVSTHTHLPAGRPLWAADCQRTAWLPPDNLGNWSGLSFQDQRAASCNTDLADVTHKTWFKCNTDLADVTHRNRSRKTEQDNVTHRTQDVTQDVADVTQRTWFM